MKKSLKLAAIAGIVNIISFVIVGILGFLDTTSIYFSILFYLTSIIFLISFIIFIYGFVVLGKKLKNMKLMYGAYLLLFVGTLINLLFFIFFAINSPILDLYSDIGIRVLGAIGIIWGLALFTIQKKFGGLIFWAAILNIIIGSLGLFFLVGSTFFLEIITVILEVVILFKAAKMFK